MLIETYTPDWRELLWVRLLIVTALAAGLFLLQ